MMLLYFVVTYRHLFLICGNYSYIYISICINETYFFFFGEVGKILFVENLVGEKKRERLHIGECRGTQKSVISRLTFYYFN
jgi:hypothetical protein